MTELKRPASVTGIGWFILLAGVVSLACIPVVWAIPELQRTLKETGWGPTEAALWTTVGGLIQVASGLAILKGLNWGRLLYLIYVPLSLLLYWLLKGFDPLSLTSIPLYVVILVLLTRPVAATFFAQEAPSRAKLIETHPPVVIRRIASVTLLTVGVSIVPATLMLFVLFLSEGLFHLLAIAILAIPLAIAVLIITAGVALWAWNRWRIVLGVVLTVGGGFSALTAAFMPLIMISPEWQALETPDDAFISHVILGYVLTALLLAAVGIPLIVAQKRRDQRTT